ncbi:MAG: flagellin N-terminal helical domain-containing protein [Phycisphaerae bacterium]
MARINTNVSSLIANNNLAKSQNALSKSIQRLSSGLRINSGADDPSGLIVSQQLKAEIQGLSTAIDNSTQAQNVISTADAALSEVSNLLVSIKGLVVQAANSGAVSSDEIQANQLQVDSAIQSITRIANSASFAGTHLLDGTLGYITSGVTASALHDVNITNASFGSQATIPVSINVVQSAQPAALRFEASAISISVTIQVQGTTGLQILSFVSGTKASAIAAGVNRVSDSTGVTASIVSATNASSGIIFNSIGYGSNEFVSVSVVNQAPASAFVTKTVGGAVQQRSIGRDALATVNGQVANAVGDKISLNTPTLSPSLNLDKAFGLGRQDFTITGGGAEFQLGAQVSSNQQVSIGISSVAASQLGNSEVGYLTDVITGGKYALAKNPAQASKIIDAAINQVSELRGRLGAFEQNTLQTNINSLQVALENVTSSNSTIEDTNFAQETSNLTRQQVLVQAGTSVLSQANSTPQAVLKLLQ